MTKPNHSNIAVDTTLTSAVNDSTTAIPVASVTGWPAVPFYAMLTVSTGVSTAAVEEIVLVTAAVGLTWTATRGAGGTSPKLHASGDLVRHVIVAADVEGYILAGQEVLSTAPNAADILTYDGNAWAPAAAAAGGVTSVNTQTGAVVLDAADVGAASTTDPRLSDARTPTSHVLATNLALGAQQTISGATAGQVLRASSAIAANFQALALADIPDAASATTLATLTAALATHAALVTGIHGLVNSGPYVFTIPATGTPAMLSVANVFTNNQTYKDSSAVTRSTYTAATGAQEWILANAGTTVGKIAYVTPGGQPGIDFFTGALANANRFTIANDANAARGFSLGYDADYSGSLYTMTFKAGGGAGLGMVGINVQPAVPLHVGTVKASSASAITTLLQLDAAPAVGVGAAGFGVGIRTRLYSSAAPTQNASDITTRWGVATHASRTSIVSVATVDTAGALINRLEVDGGSGADSTGLLLWDVNSGTLKRVTVGAADSAGAGFRQLRIAN